MFRDPETAAEFAKMSRRWASRINPPLPADDLVAKPRHDCRHAISSMSAADLRLLASRHHGYDGMAGELGCSRRAIEVRVDRLGIKLEFRPSGVSDATLRVTQMTAEEISAARDEHGSWESLARALGVSDHLLRKHAQKVGLDTAKPRNQPSDQAIVDAYLKAGSYIGAAKLLGRASGGAWGARVQQALSNLGQAKLTRDVARKICPSCGEEFWKAGPKSHAQFEEQQTCGVKKCRLDYLKAKAEAKAATWWWTP